MKHPQDSTALAPVRKLAAIIPTAQPVFDHLCTRLRLLGKTPAFYIEASGYLDQCADFAALGRRTLAAQLYRKAAEQVARQAAKLG